MLLLLNVCTGAVCGSPSFFRFGLFFPGIPQFRPSRPKENLRHCTAEFSYKPDVRFGSTATKTEGNPNWAALGQLQFGQIKAVNRDDWTDMKLSWKASGRWKRYSIPISAAAHFTNIIPYRHRHQITSNQSRYIVRGGSSFTTENDDKTVNKLLADRFPADWHRVIHVKLFETKLIKFLYRHAVVTSEALGTCVCTTCPGSLPGSAVAWSWSRRDLLITNPPS